MMIQIRQRKFKLIIDIIFIGALWGIFETTIGYFIHTISFSYSWVIMYPVACYFMICVYKKTNNISSIFFVGLICSSIKLLNLISSIRIDKVINPAISIIFESLTLGIVILALKHIASDKHKKTLIYSAVIVLINTSWRCLYIIYLIFFVPDWIKNVSIISDKESLFLFIIVQNIITCIVILLGYIMIKCIRKYNNYHEANDKMLSLKFMHSYAIQFSCALLLLSTNVILELIL